MRKHVMPLDGTFDFWVLLFAMSMSLFAAGMGMRTLVQNNALLDWNQGDSLRWIGIVFAIADATPGLLFLGCETLPPHRLHSWQYPACINQVAFALLWFVLGVNAPFRSRSLLQRVVVKFSRVCRYLATYDCSPGLLKFYVPLIVTISTLAVVLIEVRVGFGFVTNS